MARYKIVDELAGSQRDLTVEEFQQLEENILSDGKILEPITVWKNYLLDGRYRLKVAEKHGMEYEVKELDFESMEEAQQWVIDHQLGRRNVSDYERIRLRVARAKISGDIQMVADEEGVTKETIQSDIRAAKQVDGMPKDISDRIRTGSLIASKQALKRYSQLSDSQKKKVCNSLRQNPDMSLVHALPRVEDNLTSDDFEKLAEVDMSPYIRQSISAGTIKADKKSIDTLTKMKPYKQKMVECMLEDDEIVSLEDAIKNVNASQKTQNVDKIGQCKAKLERTFESLISSLDDYKVITEADDDWHAELIQSVRDVHKKWSEVAYADPF